MYVVVFFFFFFSLSLIIYWMSLCSRSLQKNMLAFELVFDEKLQTKAQQRIKLN